MNDEKHELLVKYARKAKNELEIKEYVRFKMIVYYFPEVICETRLAILLETMKSLKDSGMIYLMLNEFESGKSDYKIFSSNIIRHEHGNNVTYFLPIFYFYEILGI